MEVRAGACPAAGANAPALALAIHMYRKMIHTFCNRCANAPAIAIDDDWKYVPVHVRLAPALAPRHLITIHMYHKKHTHVANAVPLHQLAIGRD